jgi:hypothetical protein
MKKYLSRKFILTILGALSGIATALTGVGGSVGVIAGLAVTIIATATYVIIEGKIDAASVATTVTATKQMLALIEEIKK